MDNNHKANVLPDENSLTAIVPEIMLEKQAFENISPLKKSELWAWYIQNATYVAYGWVGSWILVPLLIQDMATRYGVESSNHSIPCNTNVPVPHCVTPLLGTYFEPGTISLFISSLSSVLSFFASLSIAAVADHGSYRKSLLLIFSALGCVLTLGFFAIQIPKLFWIGAILSPITWACYNVCGVFSHSFLPIFGHAHPDVLEAQARGEELTVVRKIEEQIINDLSAYSGALACLGSIIVHGVCIGISLGMHESALSIQIAIAFTGIWWLMWMLIVYPWLDARPGPPMPKGKNWVVYSWEKTYKTLTLYKQLPEIFKFMIAWFLLSDGANTMPAIMFIIIYRELGFTHVESLVLSVLSALSASLGAYVFMYFRKLWSLTTKFMILFCLVIYGIQMLFIALAPYFTDKVGLQTAPEGWFHILFQGFVASTMYGSCRAMLSELCPEGDENEWFSLYLLADKGSSWMGPFITGVLYSLTNNYRKTFWFPLALLTAGALIIYTVDTTKGRDQAKRYIASKRNSHSTTNSTSSSC